MEFKICMVYQEGTYDEIVIKGESIEELRVIANRLVEERNPRSYWSERI